MGICDKFNSINYLNKLFDLIESSIIRRLRELLNLSRKFLTSSLTILIVIKGLIILVLAVGELLFIKHFNLLDSIRCNMLNFAITIVSFSQVLLYK